MKTCERYAQLDIPDGLSAEQLMRTMSAGHGYRWTVLSTSPVLVAHGESPSSELAELLIIDRDLVFARDTVFEERLIRLLEAIIRTTDFRR